MGVLLKYTIRTLRKNRMRTFVTLVGIVLSMALVTAVIEGGYSGQQFLVRGTEADIGRFYGFFMNLHPEDAGKVSAFEGVTETAGMTEVGWAEIGSVNVQKPYLLVESIDEHFEELVAVKLIEGRMPENDSEIVLPYHLETNGDVHMHVGDTLKLSVGTRMAGGSRVHMDTPFMEGTDEITDAEERTYTVVGIMERFSWDVEYMNCPGYMALTKGGSGDSVNVFFRLKSARKYQDFTRKIWFEDQKIQSNGSLLAYSGSFSDGGFQQLLYGFIGVLVFLIAFGSISLIYNSFSISVSERTRQYGVLKSVGATKRQIRGTVFMEALTLSLIAIPVGLFLGCAGIGLTLYFLRDIFQRMFDPGNPARMQLVLNPAALGIAALLSLVTVLISAFIPAKRAIRVPPISAIRENADVRIRPRAVRTSRLTQKLFGFEGTMAAKNFKRNRRRYRATVVSLFLSIVLFISASSFSSYLTASASDLRAVDTAGDVMAQVNTESYDALMKYYDTIRLNPMTEEASVMLYCANSLEVPEDALSESFFANNPKEELQPGLYAQGMLSIYAAVILIDDRQFDIYAKACGTSREALTKDGEVQAILMNTVKDFRYEENGRKFYSYEFLKESALPASVVMSRIKEIDGYVLTAFLEDGSAEYLPQEYLDELDQKGMSLDDADPEKKIILSERDAHEYIPLTIGAVTDRLPLSPVGSNFRLLVLPLSEEERLISNGEIGSFQQVISVRSSEHAKLTEELTKTFREEGVSDIRVEDLAESRETIRMAILAINVFSYGFIILISLIAVANIFNTISTNILLRRREFAMLKSVGLSERGFRKMLNYECLIYGFKGLFFGFPAAVFMTFVIWRITNTSFEVPFFIPWQSVVIAVGSVFAVVFATMIYARRKLSKDNPIDALKLETL